MLQSRGLQAVQEAPDTPQHKASVPEVEALLVLRKGVLDQKRKPNGLVLLCLKHPNQAKILGRKHTGS